MDEDNIDHAELASGKKIIREPLTREQLYQLVWSEPMLKVAARYGVSSSYLARVCTRLHVPRPQRGYWAKLEVGKAPEVPSLPDARPGDELVWSKDGDVSIVKKTLPKAPSRVAKIPVLRAPTLTVHPLINGAKELFEVGRLSYGVGYLKPAKKLLIDMAVSKTGLDKALSFANQLLLSLEASDHRVVISPNSERHRREEVDEREKPSRNHHHSSLWSPGRITVVYVGTVAIGLTFIEMSEEVQMRYVNGTYIREADYVPPKRGRYAADHTWTTQKDVPSGRLCLQAYSPYWQAKWMHQWRETKERDLTSRIPMIVKELEQSAVEIARLVEEGERQAVIERQRWDDAEALRRRQDAERRAVRVLKESKEELNQIINEWAEAQRIEQFFVEVERHASGLNPDDNQILLERLKRAREVLGGGSSAERLKHWKLPDER